MPLDNPTHVHVASASLSPKDGELESNRCSDAAGQPINPTGVRAVFGGKCADPQLRKDRDRPEREEDCREEPCGRPGWGRNDEGHLVRQGQEMYRERGR